MEEVNVRQAINRYGTLPKDARIGAYLDSMRGGDDDPITAPPDLGRRNSAENAKKSTSLSSSSRNNVRRDFFKSATP